MSQNLHCVIYATEADALVVLNAINGILGYPKSGYDFGGGKHNSDKITSSYTYLRRNIDLSPPRAIVVDSIVESLHGVIYNGVTIDTSTKVVLDLHTWDIA